MQKRATLTRKLVLAVAGVGALMISMLATPTPVKARALASATIIGPSTVEDDVTCVWDSSTDIEGSANYTWTLTNDYGSSVVSTAPYLVLALDKANGTHQGIELTITQGSTVASSTRLIGVFFTNVGTPDCHD